MYLLIHLQIRTVIYMYANLSVYIGDRTHIHIPLHIRMAVCMYIDLYISIWLYAHTYTVAYPYGYIHIWLYAHTYTFTYMHAGLEQKTDIRRGFFEG